MASIDIVNTNNSTDLLSFATTTIPNSYASSTSLYCTSGDQTFYVTIVKNATIGTVTFRCQASGDDSSFSDVQSTRQDTGAVANEHVFNVAAGGTYRFIVTCTTARRAKSMRVSLKADVQGGAGESVLVTGTAW